LFDVEGSCAIDNCESGVFVWIDGSSADGNCVSTTGVCGDWVIVENASGDRGFGDIFEHGYEKVF
jgi:hypothetical protein